MSYISFKHPECELPPPIEIKLTCASEVEDTLTLTHNGTDFVFTCATQMLGDDGEPRTRYFTVIVEPPDMEAFVKGATKMLGHVGTRKGA